MLKTTSEEGQTVGWRNESKDKGQAAEKSNNTTHISTSQSS